MTAVACNRCGDKVMLPRKGFTAELSLKPLESWFFTPDEGWLCSVCRKDW